MAGTLTVIWWQDIPAQVVAKDRRQAHKVVLHPRFQVAIDRAAMKAGKKTANEYIEEWRRDARACGDDLEAEANAEAVRLEKAYTRDVLARLVASGGIDDGSAAGRDGSAAGGDAISAAEAAREPEPG